MFVSNFNMAIVLAAVDIFCSLACAYILILYLRNYVARNWMDVVGYSGMAMILSINAVEKILQITQHFKPYYFGWKFGLIIFLTLFLAGNVCAFRGQGKSVFWSAGYRRKPKGFTL